MDTIDDGGDGRNGDSEVDTSAYLIQLPGHVLQIQQAVRHPTPSEEVRGTIY